MAVGMRGRGFRCAVTADAPRPRPHPSYLLTRAWTPLLVPDLCASRWRALMQGLTLAACRVRVRLQAWPRAPSSALPEAHCAVRCTHASLFPPGTTIITDTVTHRARGDHPLPPGSTATPACACTPRLLAPARDRRTVCGKVAGQGKHLRQERGDQQRAGPARQGQSAAATTAAPAAARPCAPRGLQPCAPRAGEAPGLGRAVRRCRVVRGGHAVGGLVRQGARAVHAAEQPLRAKRKRKKRAAESRWRVGAWIGRTGVKRQPLLPRRQGVGGTQAAGALMVERRSWVQHCSGPAQLPAGARLAEHRAQA